MSEQAAKQHKFTYLRTLHLRRQQIGKGSCSRMIRPRNAINLAERLIQSCTRLNGPTRKALLRWNTDTVAPSKSYRQRYDSFLEIHLLI